MKLIILWRETEWHLTLPGMHYKGNFVCMASEMRGLWKPSPGGQRDCVPDGLSHLLPRDPPAIRQRCFKHIMSRGISATQDTGHRGTPPAVCLPLLILLSPTQLLLLDLRWHGPSSADSPMLLGCFKYHRRALDCLNYPPLAIFTSPSAHSSLGHIPFSKQGLCFLLRQLFVPML